MEQVAKLYSLRFAAAWVALMVPALSGTLNAHTLQQNLWVANGEVNAVVFNASNNTIYIGGDFTNVGPHTERGAALNVTTGSAQYLQGHRGNVVESVADPRIPTHEPRLHHPFEEGWKEFIGHERASILTPQTQVWVVDTALVYSTADTTRHRYSFNGQAKMTIDLTERWTNNQWVNSLRVTYTYDVNGRLVTLLYEQWTNNQWVNSLRLTYMYDVNGRVLTYLQEQWTNNQWVNSLRLTYMYDVNGRLVTLLYEQWTNNQWVNYGRGTYTYDANGRVITILSELWTNNQWVNYGRGTYTYDANGRLLTYLSEQWTNNQWVNYGRGTYTYDANGRLVTFLYEQWTNNQWVISYRSTYTYDANGNMAMGQGEIWQGGIWVLGNAVFFVADSAGNSYGWAGYRVILRYRFITTAVAHSGIEIPTQYELTQNYPNPFNPSTTISFSLPSKSFVSLKVFDALGREVSILLSEQLPAGQYSQQWNAAGFASGVYFYRLQAGSFSETKKLLLLR